MRECRAGRVSVDELALDIKDEGGVGWDVGGRALGPVRHVGGEGQAPLPAHLQPGHAHVPALQ